MAFDKLVFYSFAAILVYAATRVITVRNPVHAALHLVLAFFTCAGLWLLLEAEFLAITLVLVYVGAVMVLFLFVVMMLDINTSPIKEGFINNLPVGLTVAGLMVFEMYLVVRSKYFDAEHMPTPTARGATSEHLQLAVLHRIPVTQGHALVEQVGLGQIEIERLADEAFPGCADQQRPALRTEFLEPVQYLEVVLDRFSEPDTGIYYDLRFPHPGGHGGADALCKKRIYFIADIAGIRRVALHVARRALHVHEA